MNAPTGQKANLDFQSGLRAVLLEVIAPGLIMLMLGSLFFFLTEILYRGNYELPIHWVFGLYVFAIVLIGRISIMEGFGRAQFFAVILMLAVFIQTGLGPHWLLVLLTWWAASKLTWDCTFIDESRDVTGQGLVSAAADRWKLFREKFIQVWQGKLSLAQALEAESSPNLNPATTPESNASVASWMKDFVWKRKRKNTPGIWAFFFFVFGLVLFGGGQLFIEASDRARNFSLRMFAIYLFSGLGLMMFISLVGMFRYLKQRGTEMPDSIARAWLAVGTVFASGLVVVILFLPWPNTGVSLASLVPRFQTARRVGESILKERGKAEGPQGSGKPAERGTPGQADQPSQQQGTGGLPGGDKVGNQPQGKPGSSSGGEQSGGKGPKPASSQSSTSSSQPDKPKSGQQGQTPTKSQPKDNSSPEANAQKPSPQQGAPKSPTAQQPNNAQRQNATNQPQAAANQNQSNGKQQPAANSSQAAEKSPAPPTASSKTTQKSPTQTSTPPVNSTPPKTAPANSPPSPTSWLHKILGSLKSLFNILIWIAAAIVGLFLFVRYRHEIIDGLVNFFNALGQWFGGWRSRKNAGPPSNELVAPNSTQALAKPFADYRNPFADSRAVQRAPNEIVQYTFLAFEALAREMKIARKTDETPLEFTRRVAEKYDAFTRGGKQLADLYSMIAYARTQLAAADIEPLRNLWSSMESVASQRQAALQPLSAS